MTLLAAVAGYLLGTIPTGYLLTRWLAGADLRSVGSGGTGATNAQRALGWKWGVVVLLGDLAKGTLAVVVARGLGAGQTAEAIAGAAAVIGHCWPIWLRFRGGKGVATGAGAAVALSPWALLLIPVVVIPIALTRYVSLGSLIGALAGIVVFGVLSAFGAEPFATVAFAAIVAVVIWVKHRGNIERLIAGTERKIGNRSPAGL